MVPDTRYAKSGSTHIAYQVFGQGPHDLILVPGWVSQIDMFWDEPTVVRFFRALSSFCRVILFDKRGSGLSDRVTQSPALEERMDDVRAVLDAVGSSSATLLGYSEGGPMCALYAATHPDRTTSLILMGSYARRAWAEDYPPGLSDERMQAMLDSIESHGVRRWISSFAFRRWRTTLDFGTGGLAFCAPVRVRRVPWLFSA